MIVLKPWYWRLANLWAKLRGAPGRIFPTMHAHQVTFEQMAGYWERLPDYFKAECLIYLYRMQPWSDTAGHFERLRRMPARAGILEVGGPGIYCLSLRRTWKVQGIEQSLEIGVSTFAVDAELIP